MSPRGIARRVATAAALALAAAGPAAATRLPVADGRYCGPDKAVITVDSAASLVTIGGYACGAPLFAADKLQSTQCRRGDGPLVRRTFDLRILNGILLYDGRWYHPCPLQGQLPLAMPAT